MDKIHKLFRGLFLCYLHGTFIIFTLLGMIKGNVPIFLGSSVAQMLTLYVLTVKTEIDPK